MSPAADAASKHERGPLPPKGSSYTLENDAIKQPESKVLRGF